MKVYIVHSKQTNKQTHTKHRQTSITTLACVLFLSINETISFYLCVYLCTCIENKQWCKIVLYSTSSQAAVAATI